jgi:hypothetical protein
MLRFEHTIKTEMLRALNDLDGQYKKSVRDAGMRIFDEFAQRVAAERGTTVEEVTKSMAFFNLLRALGRDGELPALDDLAPARISGIITA